ncbi:Leiomodin-1 [Bagarius yarrelli]|uniref:Leiomodin-1 n=1 Tax=Bagarius yarrelli TaxID=175774 RepID=A0A556V3X8_BAGYA|nr:Leiomodin-1 [Bagarius yarrelli]
MRGLTQTGRQVSEDPDLDNLLSNLSPEEMEELQKEVSTVPDPDPNEIVDQTVSKETIPNKRDPISIRHSGLKKINSTEGESKRESRKQEYLRKRGLSQETNGSSKDSKEEECQSSMCIAPANQTKNDIKNINEGSSETKKSITKPHEKKMDLPEEKERRDESCKKVLGDSRTRRLQEKYLKEEKSKQEIKTEMRKREDSMTKGNNLKDKQNLFLKHKQEESRKAEVNDKARTEEQRKSVRNEKEKEDILKKSGKDIEKKNTTEEGNKNIYEVEKIMKVNSCDGEKTKTKAQNENPDTEEHFGNCAVENNAKTMSKKELEEEESCSMFAEELERLQSNDPRITHVNVNNSDVIKVNTLIQFAEALHNNTHVKTFALANCRADDHVAYAIASMLNRNKFISSINMDSNLLTSKGIMALVHALQYNTSLTELRFHNQRHICGGKTEMEITKILKENTTLLKLGYHFELAGPRMTMTNILSRNMDLQRQKRLKEQKQAKAEVAEDKKVSLKVPHSGINKESPKTSLKSSPVLSPLPSPKMTPKTSKGPGSGPPPPPPPMGILPPPILDSDFLKKSLTPMSQRKLEDRTGRGGGPNSRDQLLASIRGTSIKQLKKARTSSVFILK